MRATMLQQQTGDFTFPAPLGDRSADGAPAGTLSACKVESAANTLRDDSPRIVTDPNALSVQAKIGCQDAQIFDGRPNCELAGFATSMAVDASFSCVLAQEEDGGVAVGSPALRRYLTASPQEARQPSKPAVLRRSLALDTERNRKRPKRFTKLISLGM